MSQNLSLFCYAESCDLRLQKYGFFRNRQVFSDEISQFIYNCLIVNDKIFVLTTHFYYYLCTTKL